MADEFFFLPLLLQGAFIFIDEVFCHWRRGLARWERVGHPLDTLTLIVCFGIAAFSPFGSPQKMIYVGCSIFSCLFVTKDEWVHAKSCDGPELWLHSLMFLLHPLTLVGLFGAWERGLATWIHFATVSLVVFFLYQLIIWNVIRSKLWKS